MTTYDPKVLNATQEEKAAAFEWLRETALAGGKDWRKAAIMLEENARQGDEAMMAGSQNSALRLQLRDAEKRA